MWQDINTMPVASKIKKKYNLHKTDGVLGVLYTAFTLVTGTVIDAFEILGEQRSY